MRSFQPAKTRNSKFYKTQGYYVIVPLPDHYELSDIMGLMGLIGFVNFVLDKFFRTKTDIRVAGVDPFEAFSDR